jgi:aspartyl-tRNA(Asn)/glutamyl-tRNA(Gln) amidotransferase subunit C
MSEFSREQVPKVALLSRLEFPPEQADALARQLSHILTYIDKLNELDTEGIEPLSHSLQLTNVLRPDSVRPSLSAPEALANAPQTQDGCFRVPQIIQES